MSRIAFCLFAISLGCLPPLAGAEVFQSRGYTATVFFEHWEWDETRGLNVGTSFWISVSESREHGSLGKVTPGPHLDFWASRRDENDEELFFCHAERDLLPGQFQIDRKLNQARIATEGEVEWWNGPVSFVFDLTVTAIAPATRENRHEHISGSGPDVNYRWTGISREAKAVGTAFFNNGDLNFTPGQGSGQLINAKSMRVVVE